MTDKIALTASMRSNLLSLKNTQSLLNKTQDHLSSGYKVNSAMDNPSSFFTAQALNSRANDLSTLLDSIGQAISTLEVADQGITTLQEFVEQAKSVASSARDTSNVSSSVSSENVTFNSATAKTDKLSSYLNNVSAGDSFTIRLGDSTKMEGTANVSKDMKLSEIGVTDGMKMEMIVGDKTYNFNFSTTTTTDAVDNGDGTFTQNININDKLEDFMSDAVYTVGRKVLNAKIEDGKLSFNTMDNSSLMIRSSMAPADTFTNSYTYTFTEANLQSAAGLRGDGSFKSYGTLSVGGKEFKLSDTTTAEDIAKQINEDLALNEKGIFAQVDGTDLQVYSERGVPLATEITGGTVTDAVDGNVTGIPYNTTPPGSIPGSGDTESHTITLDQLRQLMGTQNDGEPLHTAGHEAELSITGYGTIANGTSYVLDDEDIQTLIDGGEDAATLVANIQTTLDNGAGIYTVALNEDGGLVISLTTAGADDYFSIGAFAQEYTPATAGTDVATPTPTSETVSKMSRFNDVFGFDSGSSVTIKEDMTVEQFRQALNDLDGISADIDAKGHMVISGEQGDDMLIADRSGNAIKSLLGDSVVSATNGSNERATYAKQFDNLLGQIDQLVQDTSYKGINLLKGDSLLVNFNETRTSNLNVKGVTFDSIGLGFTAADNDWIDNASIDKALNQITKATSMLRAQAAEFGQNLSTVQIREDFTQNMINNLQSGADKLTLADMNEEAANMLALQTRQQLGVNSLSLASQASQSVLQLF